MPRFDKTGPRGMGPRTGRGLGNCPTGEEYEPEKQVAKAKKEGNATVEGVIKNIIG